MKLKQGIRYIVTRPSDDGTFEKDDRIELNADGSISIINEQAFIPANELGDGLQGLGFVVDVQWVKKKLDKAYENYNGILSTLTALQVDSCMVDYWRENLELTTKALKGLIDKDGV